MMTPMKKTLCLLLLLLSSALSLTLRAQAKWVEPELYIGAAGGATLSTVTLVPTYVDKTMLMGFTGGISLRYITEKHFGVQADLVYTQAGWADKYDYGSTTEYARRINSLELPLMLHAYFATKSDVARFFINAGPQFGYIVSDEEYSQDITRQYPYYGLAIENRFQWGVGGGVGFEFHFLKRQVIGVDGHFNYYFSDYFANDVIDDFPTSGSTQVAVRAYWMFRIR